MNILYICDEYPPCQHGGIGTVTQTLAREVSKNGHTVIVAGFYPYFREAKAFEKDGKIEVHRFFYGNRALLKLSKHPLTGRFINIKKSFENYINQINHLIHKYNIDIIELPDFSEAMYYGRYTTIDFSKLIKPYIIKLHGTQSNISIGNKGIIENHKIYGLEKKLFTDAKGVIAISDFIKNASTKLYNIISPTAKISNGIHINENSIYSGKDSKTITFAGKLDVNKGVYSLVEAWKIVYEKHPDYSLQMFGTGKEKFKESLNNTIPKGIELKGVIPHQELIEMYSNSCCTIFPSYSETLGMTAIESMSVGCPTIFTKRTTGPEIIDNGKDGLLVDPDAINEIANAICFMIENKAEAIAMGNLGRNRVIHEFLISKVVEKHLIFYNQVLSSNKIIENNGSNK